MTEHRESAIAAELQRLAREHGGLLTPAVVVDAARDEKSPLHHSFDWNDTEAAAKWRLQQARQLIRVVVSYETVGDKSVPCRVFVSLTPDRYEDCGVGYRLVSAVMSSADGRQQLLADARAEMNRFRDKYRSLSELAEVFAAIERVEDQSLLQTTAG